MITYDNCNVHVYFQSKDISVNDVSYHFDFSIPEYIPDNPNMILWGTGSGTRSFFDTNMNETKLDFNEETFNKWVKPFVDQWQEKYNEAHADEIYFPNRQQKALVQLNADFETVKKRANIKSSLGFTVDANQTANENVNGLLVTISEGETVQFCDYYNQFHELTKADLETLQTEIIQNAQALYAQKWQYRTAIEACTDNEGLDAVVAGIEFNYMDFTPPAEEPTGDGEQAAETEQSAEQTE